MPHNSNSANNYTSFSDYFNANEDTEDAAAKKYTQQATDQANAAKNALQTTQNDFKTQLNAGASTNTGPGATTPQTPGSLGDVSSFQNTADKAQTAQSTLNQVNGLVGLGGVDAQGNPRGDISTLISANNPYASSGANTLSGNLVGSAGRQGFDALTGYFNPESDLNKAVVQSALDTGAAKKASDAAAAAAATKAQLGDLGASVQSDAGTAGTQNIGPPPIPDTVTTVDQAIADGYGQDQIVKKFGYAAYSDSVGSAFGRGAS